MLDRAEILHRAANCGGLNPRGHADGDRCQHVFHIVRALQRNLGKRHDLRQRRAIAKQNCTVPHKRAALDWLLAAAFMAAEAFVTAEPLNLLNLLNP